jgi:putative hydrolase of the HAD superfamily
MIANSILGGRGRQHLIFDADDTLWENNIYFEAAFERFCEFLSHSRMSPGEIREHLDEIEIANAKVHGYGARNFGRNLAECYRQLAEAECEDHHVQRVTTIAHNIMECPMELIEGVRETIALLAGHHELTLFTKGDPDEQNAKIDSSGLRPYFDHCAVVKEKNRESYLQLADVRGFNLDRTWMIGNSPKSDINPALAAGMHAVYVPHLRTWGLEKEEIQDAGGKLLVIQSFPDLAEVFLAVD